MSGFLRVLGILDDGHDEDCVGKLNITENYYIIAGGLNAKHTRWKNETNDTRGNFIRNRLDNKSIHYKTTLYSSELPSYLKGRSYLDICLADARVKFQNLRPDNTLKTSAYDSDHNALIFHVSKNTSDLLTLETQTEIPREELEFVKYLLYKIKAQMKQEFANSINPYWTNKIKHISKNDSANMFPQTNQIFRPKGQSPIPPLKLPSEETSLIQEAGITIHNTTKDTEDNPKQPDPEINYFTNYNQLNIIFSKLNNKKFSGFDGIPNILLKLLPNKIKCYYTVLFNNALNNTYFPRKWKKAKLIAITKKDKDGSSPANLRPISLLPNISKVFEIIINNPLTFFCTKNDIIPENQFGFRYKHTTIHAINKLTSDICWALNAKQRVAACLIDLEKAFDTVWIPGLIYKLIKINLPKHLIKIVWDVITSRTFVMTEGSNTSSKEFSIRNGLQQGSPYCNPLTTANYKGCSAYKTLYINRYPELRAKEVTNQTPSPPKFTTTPIPSTNQTPSPIKFIITSTSYAQAVQGIQNNPNSQRDLSQNSVPNPPNTDNFSRLEKLIEKQS
ncbi:uncharacterized protein LOC105681538, partial [Bombus impatiens]|uniref:Uncharacterized protein LOC105681538 n=1 Tax=Bombus impatiens TaxID=132113 RepID=A0A6P3V440_BOMIM